MIGLIYFGRLENEKGFDGIIDMIERFGSKSKNLPFELFVFGTGSYEFKIKELASEYPSVHFFGWKDKDTIKKYICNCQYSLMTSECIESFGLSALEGKSWGLKVIGYAKGGVTPFVDIDLTTMDGHTTGEKLYNIINQLSKMHHEQQPEQRVDLNYYSLENRKKRLSDILPPHTKKILLITDFVSKIGGIEMYILETKEILESMGYEVKLYGTKVSNTGRGKLKKYLCLPLGGFNIFAYISIRYIIKNYKPDLIWYHSVMRYLGRMGLAASRSSKAAKRLMFHDLGYFYPYPSKLTDVNNIKTPLNLVNFVNSAKTRNPIKKILFALKYLSIGCIKKVSKINIDKYIVPSEFLVDIVHKSYKISKEKIINFPHFLR